MVHLKRDRSCEYPNCIRLAVGTCQKKCGRWLCGDHIEKHDCKALDAWLVASPVLNAMPGLGASDVKGPDKDRRKAWR